MNEQDREEALRLAKEIEHNADLLIYGLSKATVDNDGGLDAFADHIHRYATALKELNDRLQRES